MVPQHLLVQGWQIMKGHVGDRVVFDVIGHIPRQKPHDAIGIGGAGVLKHVGDEGAAAMFGQ